MLKKISLQAETKPAKPRRTSDTPNPTKKPSFPYKRKKKKQKKK